MAWQVPMTETADVTVIVAHIPTRAWMLRQALSSICLQTVQPASIIVETDVHRRGAASTKNAALSRVTTEWTACLDDDDVMLPHHLETLLAAAESTGADVVYSWPQMEGGADPRPDRFGVPFDADELRRGSYIPTTALIRTELAQAVGGYQCPPGSDYDDWGVYLRMLDEGAVFHHVAQRTWIWRVHRQNTSGRPDRW